MGEKMESATALIVRTQEKIAEGLYKTE
jgi:hypothetical protein